jgi:site-specific recombinase XerD
MTASRNIRARLVVVRNPSPSAARSTPVIRTRIWGVHVIDAFERYQLGRGFSPLTVRRRTQTLRSFARHLEPSDLGDATLTDIEEWLASKRTARTRHAYRSDLRVFYDWAVKRELLASNPAALVDSIKVPKSLPRPIGPEVHAALLSGTLRQRRMIGLGLYAGLRCAEIAALDCSDVGHGVIVVRNGKGGKDRVIPLHPELERLLDGLPASGRLFTRGGRPISSAAVSRLISRHFARCGITATPHQLRHTFGTELARAAKGDLVSMGLIMGHGSAETTKGYVGWAAEMGEVVAAMYPRMAAASALLLPLLPAVA